MIILFPSAPHKVCAKHFPENQFLTVREAFNTSTGELIQVPMEYKRLVPAPSAYKFLRQSGYLVLPHPNTINHLCSKYNEKDKIVTLLLDEVHIKEYFEYKGGCVTGMPCDSEASASSAEVFMVKSFSSEKKPSCKEN
ncbi:hypothetical protein HNY73_008082 [Argiope bruennichi]|uniref:Uncharacterized protein n=1 Tax=Argiope bruennichi TaxID=94029 RepID=A0A8T0F681_ARGBR|nr:hypothetical protein HNY73_008082 [Argiope bruennichi]